MKKAFSPVIYPDSRILILGTMPGEKSLELQQYYGNRGNQFWKLIFEILNKDFTLDYNKRLELLKENKIALWDVLQYCDRQGSLDSSIKNEVPNNFKDFYATHTHIEVVLFTSKNAARYYDKYVGKSQGIHYTTLPSPSGANASMPYLEKLKFWKDIFTELLSKN